MNKANRPRAHSDKGSESRDNAIGQGIARGGAVERSVPINTYTAIHHMAVRKSGGTERADEVLNC